MTAIHKNSLQYSRLLALCFAVVVMVAIIGSNFACSIHVCEWDEEPVAPGDEYSCLCVCHSEMAKPGHVSFVHAFRTYRGSCASPAFSELIMASGIDHPPEA